MRQKLMFMAVSVIFACIFIYPMVSDAVNGQSYSGDGATNNPTVPPGGWLYTEAFGESCLTCHSTGFSGAPIKTAYLMTGHRNALRMVPGFPLTGAGGQPYSADLFGDLFNWTNSTITLQGFCTNAQYTDETSCANGGGTWLSGPKPLYYIYGGWMEASPGALYDGSYFQGGQKTAVTYSCGRCHTTGFTMDTTINDTCKFFPYPIGLVCRTPEAYFPGITWTPSNTTGKVDLDPDGNGPAISSSWAIVGSGQSLEGVQCERCHDATHNQTLAHIRKGTAATALCLQCHRQEHTVSYITGSALGSNIQPTPATDNAALPVSEPKYALPEIEVGRNDGSYAPVFYEYSTGMEYLNSVHGQFTGNFQQISDPAKYLSSFVTSSVDGGCTKCHDVHQSTVAAVNAPAPFKKTCPDCHQEGSSLGLSQLYHPSGPGTPLGDLTNIPAACAKCHMPKPNSGEGRSSHIWRISTDASYTTFPSQAQWDAGQKTAITATAGTYTNAVWIDLNLSCGQCHGNTDLAQRTAQHYFNKSALASKAAGMHAGSPWPIVCTGCHTGGGDPGAPQISPGVDHHTGGCTTCHTNPGFPQFTVTNESCLSCHGAPIPGTDLQPVVQGVNHHSGTCVSCHTAPGTPQFDLTTASCRSCHTFQSLTTMNHPVGDPAGGGAPGTCAACHFEPGVPVPTLGIQAVCGQCHGGSSSVTRNGAPYFNMTELNGAAENMHNTIPTARFTWTTDPTKDYRVLYDASTSTCPVGTTCTYSWSTGETGTTAAHTFASSATTTVTLTVLSSSGKSGSVSNAVKPVYVAEHPTSLGAGLTVTPNGFSPAVNWSVSDGVAPYTITAIWGDGTSSTVTQPLAGAGSLSHTYLVSGIYSVTVTAMDSGVNGINITTASAAIGVTISPVSVSGLVTTSTGAPLSAVSLSLQLSGVTKKITTTAANGTYAFPDVAPGTYTITASKSGYTFNNPAATVIVTGTANVTGVNFSANPPPAPVNVVGTVTQSNGITPISGVSLSLRQGGVTKYLSSTLANGTYTFANVANGTYTIVATKSGITFANPAATVTVNGSTVTANFSSLTP
jgi:hypothetical protein